MSTAVPTYYCMIYDLPSPDYTQIYLIDGKIISNEQDVKDWRDFSLGPRVINWFLIQIIAIPYYIFKWKQIALSILKCFEV